ncbi:MFS transporter [Streptomyces sp. NPDC088925]|uniref:MFS transporter n=1 Tax=Streptomyces sp. NPDC088925 TaxID=3365914 RepID=UPI00380E4B8C
MSAAQRDADTARAVPPAPEEPRKPFSWRFTTPLYLGSSLNPVNSSIIATALVPLAADLGLAVGATSVLVSSLYLASAVAQPTAGKLAEVLGARRVFLGGIVLVLLGGIVGGLGRNLATLTVARVLIGLGTSAAFPCAMVLIRRRAEAARMTKPPGSVLGGVAVAGMATAAFGPPLGGLLVGAAGWRWAFLVNIPFTLLALLMTVRWLPADAPLDRAPRPLRRIAARIDLAGVLGFAASMTALVVFLMGLPHPSWPALAVFVAAAVPTVWWELRGPEPFFDLRGLAANGALSRTYLRQALSLLGTYTVMFGVTQWTQDTYGMSALRTGLLLLPMGAVSALLSRPLAGRNLVRGPLVATALSMLAGSAGILLLSSDSPVFVLVLVSLVFGVTTATTTVGNQTMLYVAAPPDRIGTASGLFRTFGYLGTITSSVIGGIVFRAGTSDGGLHTLGFVLVGAGLAVLLLTVLDRRLMRGGGTGAGTGPAPVPRAGRQ